ncbi:MAG: DUF748 domain-containing protein [Desulfobulbaceae bacterium]|nr:DUF748 domain-containing protein [Desulfobulbaceae bacterium]
MRRISKKTLWIFWVIVLLLLIPIGSLLIDDPVRRYTIAQVNSRLDGYRVSVDDFDFNPFNLGLLVDNLKVVQLSHPDPPVLAMEELYFRLHWRELLSGRIVAVCEMVRPALHINLVQLREERRDKRDLTEKGWQEALHEFYPLEINRLEINDGEFTYIDTDPDRPVTVSGIRGAATNIRNIHDPEQPYPSPFQVNAVLFDSGQLEMEGRANFLAEPYPGVTGGFQLNNAPLGYLEPVLNRLGVFLESGIFSSTGSLEYSPEIHDLRIKTLNISDLKVDYVHGGSPSEPEKQAPEAGEESVPFRYIIENINIEGEAGFVNKTVSPDYRLYISGAALDIRGLSDRFRTGEAEVSLTGKFMDNGDTQITGTFAELDARPEFSLMIKIVGARLKSLNNLLRAYGNFDVAEGSMTIYSDITVSRGRIDGFLKPFFADVEIYEGDQEKRKDLLQKMYEGFLEAMANLLENEPKPLATLVDLSGPLENPETSSTLEIILFMIRNAFFDAILPGFQERFQPSGTESDTEQG